MNLRPSWTVLIGAFLSLVGSASAQQQSFSPSTLPLVMTAYVEASIDMRAAYETCAPADKRPAEWEQGSALLIESLKGAGLNGGVASGLKARLEAPVVRFTGDCAGEQLMLYAGVPSGESWASYHRDALGRHGIKIVEPGVTDAKLTAVRAVVAETLPKQKRMLTCLSLFDPRNFLAAFSDWNGLVAKAAEAFVTAGFGPEIYAPILDDALSDKLFTPPTDRSAAATDCVAKQDWMERSTTYGWYTLAADVEMALKAPK